jgi:hypothetical protein
VHASAIVVLLPVGVATDTMATQYLSVAGTTLVRIAPKLIYLGQRVTSGEQFRR